MNKRLVQIALLSLSVSVACFLLIAATFAEDWANDGRRSRCDAMTRAKMPGSGETRTVDLKWNGSDSVDVGIPARVLYQPGPKAEASVSGTADLISHVRIRDGNLEWDSVAYDDCFPTDLVVRLTGPAVAAWTMHGAGQLDLSDIKQATLSITKHGPGAVTASGEAHELQLRVSGTGRADLSKLQIQQTNARISGRAEVDLAPRQDADISISGSAILRLHGTGARIRSHTSGSGQIEQVP